MVRRAGLKFAIEPRSASKKKLAFADPQTSSNISPFDDEFKTTKKDKRIIKHSTFVTKIEKSRKTPLKRRRPSKKLVANLDSLVDALPDAGDEGPQAAAESQVNIIKHKSLKHRPGAMKRKEKLDKLERDRFAKNMAQMSAGLAHSNVTASTATETQGAAAPSTSGRWAALRGFISQTMEQNPQFTPAKPA
ncbi:hypothetical protein AJ80_06640 [Polytolypa hystricis UAMH7299]|uniref:Ribosome biogenesis protein SLX9 n=1 Tax=Polytolypa hystricis (strain UAMH7299) TaxID=1447883 RepID=A0A2B7XLR5_POLH7|nr:hypothetical protein AJ80_06640 [Polytolypa hystricis UAMH7299]